MWQGVQDQFVDASGGPCRAIVSLALGDQATCFVGANGHAWCAGQIDTHVYGSTFVDTGIGEVEQILMSPTFNAANHDSVCIVATGRGGECWGSNNDQGEFGDGTKVGSTDPVAWGSHPDLHRLATGTWDQICGLTTGGDAYCAGYGFGTTPVAQGQHSSIYVDTFGQANFDSATVVRAPNSRAECTITLAGYDCRGSAPYGHGGHVVDGTVQDGRACWLESDGKVTCTPWSPGPPGTPFFAPMFGARPVLAIAANFYSDAICAVYDDGSIACMGKNDHGQLGTGDTAYVGAETIVAPPGTIDTTCK